MSRSVTKRSTVKVDLADIYLLIGQDKIDPADRFLVVAEESFIRLAETPGLGRSLESQRPKLADLRFYPLPNPYRNYVVFYLVRSDSVHIVAVLPGMRDIDAVLERLV